LADGVARTVLPGGLIVRRLKQVGGRWQILLGAAIASAPLLAVLIGQSSNRPGRVALYASVGEELSVYAVDAERATLTKQSSVTLPGFVQEAWASPSTPYIYVAWSNGGASYAGTGVPAVGDKHGVTAFRIDSATGALQAHGAAATIRSRPIHITGDTSAAHLLVAYNDPSGVSVHTINRDGTVGSEIPQPSNLDVGVYAHQVRVMPTNKSVVLVTRGNQATSTTAEDPGALKVLRYDEGRLANVASIAPAQGREFRSRHLDFHPSRPWVFVTIESQNRLQVFASIEGDMLSTQPLFSKSTLANGGGVLPGQSASTVHVHPDGRFVYVGNRNSTALSAGGTNDIAVFRINQQTGEPSLTQNVDTRGVTPRTFSIDPAGRLLVVGNQTTLDVTDGTNVRTIPANLAVFRIQQDGRLEFARRYDVAVGRKPLWWAGLVALPAAASR
jgi:6-phosphogluconolactonase (cycloisomerase 2 family)